MVNLLPASPNTGSGSHTGDAGFRGCVGGRTGRIHAVLVDGLGLGHLVGHCHYLTKHPSNQESRRLRCQGSGEGAAVGLTSCDVDTTVLLLCPRRYLLFYHKQFLEYE